MTLGRYDNSPRNRTRATPEQNTCAALPLGEPTRCQVETHFLSLAKTCGVSDGDGATHDPTPAPGGRFTIVARSTSLAGWIHATGQSWQRW